MKHVQASVTQAVSLGLPGLLVGVAAGWLGLWRADGAGPVAAVILLVYWSLLLALPATMALWTLANLNDADQVLYLSLPGSVLMQFFGGLLGGLLATAFFLVVAINVAAIFGGEDQVLLRLALLAELSWGDVTAVMLVTAVSGAMLAWWANRQMRQTVG